MAGDIHSSTFRIHKTSMKCALHIFLKYFMDCLENNLSRNFSTFLGYKKNENFPFSFVHHLMPTTAQFVVI